MSDSQSRGASKALYVELSSTPKISSPKDDKFNAVSKLRSLFDHNNVQPVLPRRSSDGVKRQRPQSLSSSGFGQTLAKSDDKDFQTEEPKKQAKYEKIEMERKKKLFGPRAPITLDDLLRRETPRSPEDVPSLPNLRRQFSPTREPYGSRDQKRHTIARTNNISKQPEESVKDNFEEIHKKRRAVPKKRSSSFEFEGLEDNVKVYGERSIDINAMLGCDAPKEDPITEEETRSEAIGEEIEKTCMKQDEPEVVAENRDKKYVEDSEQSSYNKKEDIIEAEIADKVDPVALEPVVRSTDVELEKSDSDLKTIVKYPKPINDIVEEDIINESIVKDMVEEEPSLFDFDTNANVSHFDRDTEESRKAEKPQIRSDNFIDEEFIVPKAEDCAESGIDFNSLENAEEDVDMSCESTLTEPDSFDSLALHVQYSKERIEENDLGSDIVSKDDTSVAGTKIKQIFNEDVHHEAAGLDIKEETIQYNDTGINVEIREDPKSFAEECFVESQFENNVDKDLMKEYPEEPGVGEEVRELDDQASFDKGEDSVDIGEEVLGDETENNEDASLSHEGEPVIQLSMFAKVAGLDEEKYDTNEEHDEFVAKEDLDEKEDDNNNESAVYSNIANLAYDEGMEEKDLSNTVTLEDEEYDSDNCEVDKTDLDATDLTEVNQSSGMDDGQITLPSVPVHSCLLGRNGDKKKDRKVSFQSEKNSVIFTYSATEYNRSNSDIDALTASAEWELEKRVDDKDMFTVDLDKSKFVFTCLTVRKSISWQPLGMYKGGQIIY